MVVEVQGLNKFALGEVGTALVPRAAADCRCPPLSTSRKQTRTTGFALSSEAGHELTGPRPPRPQATMPTTTKKLVVVGAVGVLGRGAAVVVLVGVMVVANVSLCDVLQVGETVLLFLSEVRVMTAVLVVGWAGVLVGVMLVASIVPLCDVLQLAESVLFLSEVRAMTAVLVVGCAGVQFPDPGVLCCIDL